MLLHVKVELISVTPLTFNNISECICWFVLHIDNLNLQRSNESSQIDGVG